MKNFSPWGGCLPLPRGYIHVYDHNILTSSLKPLGQSIEETVGSEIFRFAQHPPHTRFDTMGGFFDQYKELLGTLSPCDMVHLSSRSRYACYPFKPEMCSKFVKYTMNL